MKSSGNIYPASWVLRAGIAVVITFFISTSDCLGEDAHAFLQSQNPTELDRFILDGMKEAKVPGLASMVTSVSDMSKRPLMA